VTGQGLVGRILSHSTRIGALTHKTTYQYDAAARLAARKVQAGNQLGHVTQR
jgi:YD repeat-containing protein